MTPQLFAARYDDYDYTGTDPVETFQDVQDIGLRWNLLKGGIQRFELTIRASSDFDAYDRYKNHLGQLIAIYDSYVDRYIAGNVFEIIPNGRSVTYICGGPKMRLYDLLYNLTHKNDLIPATDTDVAVKDILDDATSTISSDQSNIDATGQNMGAWKPVGFDNEGMFPGKALEELSEIGNTSNERMDFYLVDQPFDGVQLQKPLPYFKARSTTASHDWLFSKSDIAPGGLTMARHIWQLATYIKIGFGNISGTHNGGNSAHLINSVGAFEASGVSIGDRVHNMTDGNSWRVEAFVDPANDDEIDMVNAPNGTEWANGERYIIEMSEMQWTAQATDTNYWIRAGRPKRPEMDGPIALVFRDQYHNLYKDAVLQQAFVLGTPKISDGNGAKLPLWRPLMGNSFYFRVNDLFPAAAVFGSSDDREQTFLAVAMDYTYRDNRLRIVPATGDSRLDVLMAQALAEKRNISEIISTATG